MNTAINAYTSDRQSMIYAATPSKRKARSGGCGGGGHVRRKSEGGGGQSSKYPANKRGIRALIGLNGAGATSLRTNEVI